MNGHAGRDHWSDCFSVLLAGGGIKGGRIVGASEKWGGGVLERLVTPLDLLATIYHAVGDLQEAIPQMRRSVELARFVQSPYLETQRAFLAQIEAELAQQKS